LKVKSGHSSGHKLSLPIEQKPPRGRLEFAGLGLVAFILLGSAFAGEEKPGQKAAEKSAERPAAPPAGPRIEIYAAHNQIEVFDASERKAVGRIDIDEVVNGIAFSRDGSRAYVGTSGGKDPEKSRGGVYVIDTESRKRLSKISESPVKALRTHCGGKLLHILEWNVHLAEQTGGKKKPVAEQFHLRTFSLEGPEPRSVSSVAVGMDLYDFTVSPDGKTAYLLDPGHNQLRIMELPGGRFLEVMDLAAGQKDDGTYREAAPARLVLDPGGAQAAVLLNGSARTGAVLLDLDGRTRKGLVVQNGSNLRDGAFLPGGKRMLLLALSRLLVLDLAEGKLVQAVPLTEVFTSLALSPTGDEVYLGAPVALRTPEARGGGLVEVLEGGSFAPLARMAVPITVKLIALAPARKPSER
jgi:DNA-binding beta-propeller fold protein YncE